MTAAAAHLAPVQAARFQPEGATTLAAPPKPLGWRKVGQMANDLFDGSAPPDGTGRKVNALEAPIAAYGANAAQFAAWGV